MTPTILSEADLRLTAKAVRKYMLTQKHIANRMGTQMRSGRVVQLKRLERVYLKLADAAIRNRES